MHIVSLDLGFEGSCGLAIEKGTQYFKKGNRIAVEGEWKKWITPHHSLGRSWARPISYSVALCILQ